MNRNETYEQGAKPGDAPISVEEVPIDPELILLGACYKRLQDFDPNSIKDPVVREIIADLLVVLDLEDAASQAMPSPISDVITSSIFERLKRRFHGTN